jgi:ABC-type nitrate/sulfonate/bicarbonate transport system substrate-binding protein
MLQKRIFILSALGALFVGGCGASPPADTAEAPSSDSAEAAPSDDLIPVKAGHLVALDMAPLFVGVESGCFEQNGLAVETVFFTNPGDNNAALAGEPD